MSVFAFIPLLLLYTFLDFVFTFFNADEVSIIPGMVLLEMLSISFVTIPNKHTCNAAAVRTAYTIRTKMHIPVHPVLVRSLDRIFFGFTVRELAVRKVYKHFEEFRNSKFDR